MQLKHEYKMVLQWKSEMAGIRLIDEKYASVEVSAARKCEREAALDTIRLSNKQLCFAFQTQLRSNH